jgi:hypothetical protein
MTTRVRILLPAILAVSAAVGCGAANQALAAGGKANIALTHAQASLLQTSDTPWTLAKTGVVDGATQTVTWDISATPGTTVDGKLTVDGFLGVTNIGTGPATIGNIVINLQVKQNGEWVTRVSDIADATHGDGATWAHVVAAASSENLTYFTEGPGSGALSFMDRKTNTVWSLVPQVTIPAFSTVRLLFAATFDNNALHLPTGTPTRTEVIVTFGNHPEGGPVRTDEDVDINGNGLIDPEEAKVRSVSTRFKKPVPDTQAANATVTLADSVDDLRAAGTVTYSNPMFQLGATTGTVTVTYDPGASGGSITNCAHATGGGVIDPVGQQHEYEVESAVDLDACNTQTIDEHTCSPGEPGCGWHDGDMLTYTQVEWGAVPNGSNAASILANNYDTLYAPFGLFEIGHHTGPYHSVVFGSSVTLLAYLPTAGPAAVLDADLLDPMSTASGVFGGDMAALKLNIDYSDAGAIHGTASVRIGDLRLCALTATPDYNGLTVRQALVALDDALSGAPVADAIADLDLLARQIDGAFYTTSPSGFAQDHLVVGACP